MIKLICFDFDGVLCDLKHIHYKTFNDVLTLFGYKEISTNEHVRIYDGLSTLQKLKLLEIQDEEEINRIFDLKQKLTLDEVLKITKDRNLIQQISKLKKNGFHLSVNSNAIRNTVVTSLEKLGILHFFDLIVTNEDVINKKPHPEIYWKSMIHFGASPKETLIVEDSKVGRESAYSTNALVYGVDSPKDINAEKINEFIENEKITNINQWPGKSDLNILVPMAGHGSRFSKEGYKLPKPLIDVDGKPMIQRVVECVNIDANFIFIVLREHYEKYSLQTLLPLIKNNCKIITVESTTEGAACTCLLAEQYINNQDKLIIVNSDQILDYDSYEFMYKSISKNVDGAILTFKSNESKWSYVKEDEHGFLTEVKEKEPISNLATCGLYYYKHGSDFVKYAKLMIEKNVRVNNEFYVVPIYNEFIKDNKKIIAIPCKEMHGVGTPEDLKKYLMKNEVDKS